VLVANQIAKGFGTDIQFEVTASGAAIGTINGTRRWFELDNQRYQIFSSGFLSPKKELKRGDTLIATASQKMFRNSYTIPFGSTEWTFKATVLLATTFGLFENETQVGTVTCGPHSSRLKDVTADLPDKLPREIQMFLLAIFIDVLTQPSSSQ
jgi:hypothetical protein